MEWDQDCFKSAISLYEEAVEGVLWGGLPLPYHMTQAHDAMASIEKSGKKIH